MTKKTTMEIVPVKKVPAKRTKQSVVKTEIVSPEALIMQAMNQGASFETIKEMLDLKERLQKQEAEKMFRIAMSKFQAECPIIIKSNGVDYTSKKSGTRVKYNYASLDKIIATVKGLLGKYELSYTFTTNQSETSVTAICHAFHIAGHVESTLFTVPIDPEAYMNAAQKVASALTYAKRYAFCNAFGILTGDIDDDADALSPEDKKQNVDQKAKEAREQLNRFLKNNKYIKEAFEILEYKDRAQWAFCNGHKWKVEMIKKHLDQLVENKNSGTNNG
jgi:hypothetical protein